MEIRQGPCEEMHKIVPLRNINERNGDNVREIVLGKNRLTDDMRASLINEGTPPDVVENIMVLVGLLKKDGQSEISIANAVANFKRFLQGQTGFISDLQPAKDVADYKDLAAYEQAGREAVSRVAVVNLNGGLGTSMGLSKAKSLLRVKDDYSFLGIIEAQIEQTRKEFGIDLPALFMNSFSTDEDTKEVLKNLKNTGDLPISFLQNKVRKINLATKQPVVWSANPECECCPPGHGDIFAAMSQSGLLEKLQAGGMKYLFISNADNLGASLDLRILGYLASSDCPMLMEVADRTESDKKGGHLAFKDGKLILRELAQCPENELDDFQDIKKYSYFNTNSLWFNLDALIQILKENNGVLQLPLIVNKKTVDPRDKTSIPVVQLETAMGAAIASFEGARAVRVPRSRFAPVKTTDDLLVIRSDRYMLTSDKRLVLNPVCKGGIEVSLGTCFKRIDEFEKRFASGVPSLKKCTSLKIQGDFLFGKDIVMKGDVELLNASTKQVVISDGTVLEGRCTYY